LLTLLILKMAIFTWVLSAALAAQLQDRLEATRLTAGMQRRVAGFSFTA
jgi:hypothetical protein